MTIPSAVISSNSQSQKEQAAGNLDDETQSTYGHQSEYSPTNVLQTMKLARVIALSCLGMTAVLALFVMINSGGCRCDCRGVAESSGNPFYESLIAGPSEVNGRRKGMPLRIEMQGDAGELLKRNKKGKVNCSVERKVATQIIASEPKLLITPYGNITTDPRIIHMTGEKMIFTCNAGKAEKKGKKGDKHRDSRLVTLSRDSREREGKKETTKFSTVLNLNDIVSDKEDRMMEATTSTSMSANAGMPTSTSTTSESPLDRPKRSTEGRSRPHRTHMTCDCHCPQDAEPAVN